MGSLPREGVLSCWPIGSIYLSMSSTNPSNLFGGEWKEIGQGRVLMGETMGHAAGSTVNSGLPDIQGEWTIKGDSSNAGVDAEGSGSGAIINKQEKGSGSNVAATNWNCATGFKLKASNYNAIYGASSIVQPPALFCYMFQRTA